MVHQFGPVIARARATLKKNIGYSIIVLTHGASVRLPEEFFEEASVQPTVSDDVQDMRIFCRSLRYTQPRSPTSRNTYVDKSLSSCPSVLVRVDAVGDPLQRPYVGSFLVSNRAENFFTSDLCGDLIKMEFYGLVMNCVERRKGGKIGETHGGGTSK